jgi:Queuosine biosynthesis protein QueC
MSINLPISTQLVGARDTRTTHPLVLNHFRNFFSAAIGETIEVDNPFIWKTKRDVVRSIINRGCGELIKQAVSCTRVHQMSRDHTHCGCCSQCIDRRFAILARIRGWMRWKLRPKAKTVVGFLTRHFPESLPRPRPMSASGGQGR